MEHLNRTEEDFIKEYLDLAIELQIRESETQFYSDHPKIELIRQQEDTVREKRDRLYSDLKKFENEEKSLEIRRNLLKVYAQMKAELQYYDTKLPISRRQGMTGENYFASKIFELIRKVIYLDFTGISRPFLYVTNDSSDSIEKRIIIEFFDNEERELMKMTTVNFPSLFEYFKLSYNRLLKLTE
jgi:hypothetical protein